MSRLTTEEYIAMRLKELKALMNRKSPEVFDHAKRLMVYTRSLIPDWVEALANGNPDELEAVIEIALADMNSEVNHDDDNLAAEHPLPTTGRTAFLCQMPDGKFGLQIGYENAGENKFTELTNFVKEQLKRIEQVEKYLRNRGYTPVGK